MKSFFYFLLMLLSFSSIYSQDYFLKNNGPYNENIQTPEEFLGYEIGFQHTRHDLIVSYLNYLSNNSEKAELIQYGKTHEGRNLVILTVSSEDNLKNLQQI